MSDRKTAGQPTEKKTGQSAEISSRKRRSGISIMGQLIGLVTPLLPVMLLAIVLGTIGYLCAIFLTIVAAYGLMHILLAPVMEALGLQFDAAEAGVLLGAQPRTLFAALIVMAVTRGILHYGEQYCNHFIAFKLLAIIRHKVFAALRKLCPAKLEGRDKGNLISVITSDIELLEVFYAHTISPIAIAVLTSFVMVLFIGQYSAAAGVLALGGYVAVGVVIPLFSEAGEETGEWNFEMDSGNSTVLFLIPCGGWTRQFSTVRGRRDGKR